MRNATLAVFVCAIVLVSYSLVLTASEYSTPLDRTTGMADEMRKKAPETTVDPADLIELYEPLKY